MGTRVRLLSMLVVAVVLAAVTATAAPGAPSFDPATPPSPDLRRPVMLSLARRVVPTGGVPLPVGGADVDPYRTGPAAQSPEIIPPPPLVSGTGALYAVGDSVLLGAEPYLRTTLDGWDVRLDARVSRGVPEGFDLVRLNRDRIGDVLVVVLGHNYGGGGKFGPWLENLLSGLTDVPRVVLVTVTEWSGAQPEVNRAIRQAPARHPNVVVADWAAVAAANPQFLRDHVHTTRSGAVALANLIAVMAGPAPSVDGRPPPRPRLLPIPDEPRRAPVRSTTTTTVRVRPGGTGSTSTSASTSTTRPAVSSTTTTEAAPTSTTTSSVLPTTSTTEVTTTTTAGPTTTVTEPPPAP